MNIWDAYETAKAIRCHARGVEEHAWQRIGHMVRERRLASGMSQADVAKMVNRSVPTICKLEAGVLPISKDLLKKIDKTLLTVNNDKQQR